MAKEDKNSAQSFVEIEEIRGPVLILKDGSLRAVIEASSINFELKSSDEKIAILRGFQNFLNSVDFPIQMVINSRRLDISDYIAKLKTTINTMDNEMLRVHAVAYTEFVEGLAKGSNIVVKQFYIVIPYYVTEITLGKVGLKDKIRNLFAQKKVVKKLDQENLNKYLTQLEQRVGVIRTGVEALGVRTSIMTRDKLIKMYHGYYNQRNL